jgi:hypothetical protein
MDHVTPGVVRVAHGGSLLRAQLHIVEEAVTFGGGDWYPGLRSWHIEVEGGLPLTLMGQRVSVVLLTSGNRFSIRGEAWITDVQREVIDRVGEPLRFVWSSRLDGSGPLTLTGPSRSDASASEPSK